MSNRKSLPQSINRGTNQLQHCNPRILLDDVVYSFTINQNYDKSARTSQLIFGEPKVCQLGALPNFRRNRTCQRIFVNWYTRLPPQFALEVAHLPDNWFFRRLSDFNWEHSPISVGIGSAREIQS